MKICRNGFAALAKTDEGYFGRGIYFTHFMDYAAGVYGGNKGEQVVVLSWVQVGNVYPVTENPFKANESLKGKPLQKVLILYQAYKQIGILHSLCCRQTTTKPSK